MSSSCCRSASRSTASPASGRSPATPTASTGSRRSPARSLTPTTLARAWAKGVRPKDALADNDGHGFFAALGDQVVTGPTLTNVNDFRAVIVGAAGDGRARRWNGGRPSLGGVDALDAFAGAELHRHLELQPLGFPALAGGSCVLCSPDDRAISAITASPRRRPISVQLV